MSSPVRESAWRILFTAMLGAVVAACGTTRQAPVVSSIPQPMAAPSPAPSPNPVYKVGMPYQVAGIWYYPKEQPDYDETGIASWYGADFHGRLTANGEVFDRTLITAAHPTLPMPVNARVTNLENGRSIVVRINDRGPYVNGRIIDLSEQAASLLGYREKGTARVRVTFIGRADLYGPGPAPPSQETPPEIAMAVPAAPTMEVASAQLNPVAGVRVAPPPPIRELPRPVERVTTAPLPQIPDGSVTAVPVPSETAIYVQAGAFASASNAGSVATKLYNLGARVQPTVKDGHMIYRVRIGPFQNVQDADATLARVQALGHNDVQIVVDAVTS